MSGTEALVVLGILANVFSVVEFSNKAIDRVKEALENTQDLPKAFRTLQTLVPLVVSTLHKTEQQARARELGETTCKALVPVIQQCGKTLEDLNDILDKVVPVEGSSRWKRGLKAISSIVQDKKVEEIVKSIESYITLLTYHHVATAPTAAQITSLVAGMSSATITAASAPASTRKTYYMAPIQWSDNFTGRDEIMGTLGTKLCQTGRHSRIALVGLGGVGKTRIALQFANNFKSSKENSVFWVHAGNAERLKKSYFDIVRKVAMPGCDAPQTNVLQLVKDWLEGEESGRWLLVIDNADNMEMLYGPQSSDLASYFPRSNNGSILMTTRYRKVGIKFATAKNTISIPVLSPDESHQFLESRLGHEVREDNNRRELAEELGNIPLALVQAASFITENQISERRAAYLQYLPHAMVLLTCEQFKVGKHPSDLPLAFQDSRLTLEPTSGGPIWPRSTVLLLSFVIRTLRSSGDHSLARLTTQRALVVSRDVLGDRHDVTRDILLLMAQSLFRSKDYAGAEKAFRQLIDCECFLLGDFHPTTLSHTSLLVETLFHLGLFDEAMHIRNEMLERCTKVLGPSLPEKLVIMSRVARDRALQGRVEESGALAIDTMRFVDKVGWNKIPWLSFIVDLLLDAFYLVNCHAEAEYACIQLYTVTRSLNGESHLQTLYSLRRLSVTYKWQRRWDKAEQLQDDILKRGIKTLGPRHPIVVNLVRDLSHTYFCQERFVEAEELCSIVLKCRQEFLDERHPDIIESMANLALIYERQDRYGEALELRLRAVEYQKRTLGETDLDTIDGMAGLGINYFNQKIYDKVEEIEAKVLEFRREILGYGHIDTRKAMWNLSSTMLVQNKSADAARLAHSTVILCGEARSEHHPEYLWYRELYLADYVEDYGSRQQSHQVKRGVKSPWVTHVTTRFVR